MGHASQGQNFMAGVLCNELNDRGLRLLNTVDTWWLTTTASSTTSSSTSSLARSTRKGHLFGVLTHRPGEYLIADVVTAQRVDASVFDVPMAYPSDHKALGVSYDLVRDIGMQRSRPTAKPIGWWP